MSVEADIAEIETIDDLIKSADECELVASKLKFDRNNSYHQMLVGIFLASIERARAIVVLLEKDMANDAETILRALLESVVELVYLSEDPVRRYTV